MSHDGYGFTSAMELREAVLDGLLTEEEARTVYWSQFAVLRQQANMTPPAIESKA